MHSSWSNVSRGRSLSLIVIIGLTVTLASLIGHRAYAADVSLTNALGNAIFLILSTIVWALTKLLASLTGLFVSLMVSVARYNVFLNAPVVKIGWPIVRDLMNMMFIIALLVISAGTVLRLQNYRYNRLLGKLIIMALLVNFSKFIAVFLLQFAQVVMLTFVNAFRDIAFGNFTHMFGLDSVLTLTAQNNPFQDNGTFSVFVTLVASLALMLVAFVVMLAITVMLFVRIIALWFLIILSPVAYALRVLPNTERYASQWWAEFTKYAVLGPVLAFFLWISLALVGSSNTNCQGAQDPLSRADCNVGTSLSQNKQDTQALSSDFVNQLLDMNQLITFIIGIIFLMLGLQYATKAGTAGASFASRVSQAGFGAAATVTGLNAIRDRAVTPVQGWIKNRQGAQRAAIQERTESLEAAGDRARAAIGRTAVGRNIAGLERGTARAQAAATAYERTQNIRTAQRQSTKDQTNDQLRNTFLNSQDMRQRTVAMQELQSRNRLNLADNAIRTAFNTVTNATRSINPNARVNAELPEADRRKIREEAITTAAETADWPQAQAMLPDLSPLERAKLLRGMNSAGRLNLEDDAQHAAFEEATNPAHGLEGMTEADRRKFRQDTLKSNADRLSEADLRRMETTMTTGGGPVDADELSIIYQALERKDALNAERAPDREIANRVRANLAGNPQKLRQFEDDMKKNNANMAKAVIYNGFQNGVQSGQQVLSDIQAGLFSASNLTQRDLATLRHSLETAEHFDPGQARNFLHNGILNGARSKEEYDRIMNSMNYDARHAATYKMGRDDATGTFGLDQTISREKRDWVAAQGAHGEAYEGVQRAGRDIGDILTRQFVDDNPDVVLRNMREGKITRGTVRNHSAYAAAAAHNKIGRSGFDMLLSEHPEYRDDVFNTGRDYVIDLDIHGQARTDNSTAEGLAQNAARDIAMAAGRGRDTIDSRTGAMRSSADSLYEVADATQAANARIQRQSFFTRQGGTQIQLNIGQDTAHPSLISQEAHRDVITSTSPEAINAIADRNTPLAQRIVTEKRAVVDQLETKTQQLKDEFHDDDATAKAAAAAATTLLGSTLSNVEAERLRSQVQTLRRSPRGL